MNEILAQFDWRIASVGSAILLALFGYIIRHVSNAKKHPCKDDIVYRDVCQANRDCIERGVENLEKNLTDTRKEINRRFDKVEELIKDGR